jgi:DNA-binding NarL/FixJ family response regulator
LEELFRDSDDFEVCGFATTINGVDPSFYAPDIVALDILVDKSNGIGAVKELNRRYPRASVLIACSHDERIFAERSLRGGAKGRVIKAAPIEEHL